MNVEIRNAELDNFFLHPKYMGKILGQKLWDACCNKAREFGRNEFIIWSDTHAEHYRYSPILITLA